MKKRIAFTIILNGLHHIMHNNYYKFILENFDYWVVIDGATNNNGSTSWCKKISDKYHNNGASIDGTVQFLSNKSKQYKNLIFIKCDNIWDSKDQKVNVAINEIKKITNNCFLWEIDIDEQWNKESLIKSEQELIEKNGKTGCFLANHYVGKNLIAKGEWGEGVYNRLWDWYGETFEKHEEPVLSGGNGNLILLNQRFNHFSYYFEKDVIFKNDWYSGHENILENWRNLQLEINFPIHISKLISGYYGNTNTYIYKI